MSTTHALFSRPCFTARARRRQLTAVLMVTLGGLACSAQAAVAAAPTVTAVGATSSGQSETLVEFSVDPHGCSASETVYWNATGGVRYSEGAGSDSYGADGSQEHFAQISGLTPGSVYHWYASATTMQCADGSSGQQAATGEQCFRQTGSVDDVEDVDCTTGQPVSSSSSPGPSPSPSPSPSPPPKPPKPGGRDQFEVLMAATKSCPTGVKYYPSVFKLRAHHVSCKLVRSALFANQRVGLYRRFHLRAGFQCQYHVPLTSDGMKNWAHHYYKCSGHGGYFIFQPVKSVGP